MQITSKKSSDTSVELTVVADADLLSKTKTSVLKQLAKTVKLQGFRDGKAPLNMVEKNLDPATLQNEFINEAVNKMYLGASEQEKLSAATQPKVDIKKFVPFSTLEIVITADIIGEVKLSDYTKIKLDKRESKVSDKDVDGVIENLLNREADKKEVKNAAKNGDEITIDFSGSDPKTGETLPGTDGADYPLGLGTDSFIPGFEKELVGLKTGDEKSFDITFPKDYGATNMQGKKVTFAVTVKKVSQLDKPKLDDKFASEVGPFKTVDELKTDIKKQLGAEQDNQAKRELENSIIEKVVAGSKVAIPDALVEEQLDAMENEERQNLVYRGQTWEEHLKAEGVTGEEHRQRNKATAKQRVTAGVILSEIAEREKVNVSPEELEIRIQLLKGQYTDPQMQAELDKPEGRRDILSRMVTEKTLHKLVGYATGKK